MNVYVDCACRSGIPSLQKTRFMERLVALDEMLEVNGFVSLHLSHEKSNGHSVAALVKGADCVVVLCDYPSAGVSVKVLPLIEIWRKPLFAFAHRGLEWNVFEFVRGVWCICPYDTIAEIPKKLEQFMQVNPLHVAA